jgi:AraC family transcriptional regulator of adaptative response/methylated-DNA-[protein]-cysteine methyltransferase
LQIAFSQSGENLMSFNLTDDQRWQAVESRDKRYDGAFVTAVLTTKIYCRPSCPARHPHRENVEFYGSNAEAEAAGFRPCRRCRPDEVDAQFQMVQQACAYLEANYEESPTLETLSAHLHVSPFHLQRVFKRIMGVSPRQYADQCRLKQFKSQLKEGDSVTRALYDVGYNSSSRLYPGQLGMTPTNYQKGGKGMTIDYMIVECALGYLLVGATERGVCSVMLGDSPQFLENALMHEFPAAGIRRAGESLRESVNMIVSYLDGQTLHLDLPLDIQATAFQRRVWEALRAIPYGTTRSYGDIAKALGDPKAVRAVANACASNHVALVIPCHRVVRENGDLGGYKWGIERKKALLERERAVKA